jgi:uncharacterized membrane protein
MTTTAEYRKSFFGHLRTTFLRGMGVIIPLGLTYWFFNAFLNFVDNILSPILREIIGRHIPGLGFMTMVVLILLVGLLTRNLIGRLFFSWVEEILTTIPFVRSVYSAVKDLVGAFVFGGKGRTFRKVVMIEYPRKGLFTIGFVTNEMSFTRPDGTTIDFLNVYIPNPPNPTSGVLCLVPKPEAVQLSLSIEEGLKLVLSGGIVLPEKLTGSPVV